jgi:DNA-binding transcriptional ArsR family regulator
MRTVLSCTTLENMPDIFGVISDATRRDILRLLLDRHEQGSEISVSEIVAKLELSQPTVSKHLKVLREAELVSVREEGQHRFYSLEPEPLEVIEDFVIPFLSAGFDTEVTIEYRSESGELLPNPEDDEVLPGELASAAGNLGRAVASAEHRVKELVARFRLRA